jgi:hypothetical protein
MISESPQPSGRLERNDLVLEFAAPDDPRLPKPRGRTMRKPSESPIERSKLEATKRLGGLVPEYISRQYWACTACREIYGTRENASQCCKAGANRVQPCSKCSRRFSDCTCARRF